MLRIPPQPQYPSLPDSSGEKYGGRCSLGLVWWEEWEGQYWEMGGIDGRWGQRHDAIRDGRDDDDDDGDVGLVKGGVGVGLGVALVGDVVGCVWLGGCMCARVRAYVRVYW